MGKYDGFLICSDCDWTLTDYEKKVSAENAAAIKYFQENGGLFTVATGRPPHYVNTFKASFTPNTYVVAANGTVLYDLKADREVYSVPLKRDPLPLLRYIFENIPSVSEVSATNSVEDVYGYGTRAAQSGGLYKDDDEMPIVASAEDLVKIAGAYKGELNRLIFVQDEGTPKENLENLRAHFPEYKFTQSWDVGIEAQDPSGGKGELIGKLREFLPAVHTVIGVGDNDNDISMLNTCDISYAVANAVPHVKEAADRQAPACDESAIAWIIKELGRNL